MKNKKKNLLSFLILICSLIFSLFIFTSCGEDEPDVLPPAPTLTLDANGISLERGQSVDITLTLAAPSGIASLTVNGTAITTVTAGETTATTTYTYSVAETDEFGDVILDFILTDEDNRTAQASFTVTVVGSTITVPAGTLAEDQTWESENVYILSGELEIETTTLTIEAGTRVYMAYDADSSYRFIVRAGGQILADGTEDAPIVFSSERSLQGNAEPGDWDGIRLEGEAGVSTGTLRYVRIEYASNDNAALRLQQVDASTNIDFVQVFRPKELGIETRGGTVNMRHVMVTEAENTSIELDDDGGVAYTGNLQYVIIQSGTFTEKGSRDFESRDDADYTVANMTMIGSGRTSTGDEANLNAMRIRDDTEGFKMYNILVAEYNNDGIRVDDHTKITDLDGDYVIAHSYIFQIGDQTTRDDQDPSQALLFETQLDVFSNVISAEDTPAEAAGIGITSFVPDAEITSSFDPTSLGDFFEAATFVGAIGDSDWTAGWSLNPDGSSR